MKNNCYCRLNINTENSIKQDIISSRYGKYLVENFTTKFDEIFNKSWLDELTEKVGSIKNVMIFSRPAFWSTRVSHVDLKNDKTPVWFSLNWIISGKDSEMVWHHAPENYLNSENIQFTMSKNMSLQWPVKELPEIERCTITDKMIMARTDIPHSIIVKSEPRIAIAVRTFMSNSSEYSWEKSIEYYKKQGLILE